MKALHQSIITGALLLAVRETEAQRGQLLAHHDRAEHALRPTQTRKSPSRSVARREAKLRNRYRAAVALQWQHVWGKPAFGYPGMNLETAGDFRFV
jgi:hypothetical protein